MATGRIEERLKQIIGEQTVLVVVLQTQIEELTAENAQLKAASDGMPAPKPVKK